MGELVDGLTDVSLVGLAVLGENVDIQLGKDDGSNDGELDGSTVDDAVGGWLVGSIAEDSDEDPVVAMDGA